MPSFGQFGRWAWDYGRASVTSSLINSAFGQSFMHGRHHVRSTMGFVQSFNRGMGSGGVEPMQLGSGVTPSNVFGSSATTFSLSQIPANLRVGDVKTVEEIDKKVVTSFNSLYKVLRQNNMAVERRFSEQARQIHAVRTHVDNLVRHQRRVDHFLNRLQFEQRQIAHELHAAQQQQQSPHQDPFRGREEQGGGLLSMLLPFLMGGGLAGAAGAGGLAGLGAYGAYRGLRAGARGIGRGAAALGRGTARGTSAMGRGAAALGRRSSRGLGAAIRGSGIAGRIGARGALGMAGRLGMRALPWVGWGMLGYDAYGIGRRMWNGQGFGGALHDHYLGEDDNNLSQFGKMAPSRTGREGQDGQTQSSTAYEKDPELRFEKLSIISRADVIFNVQERFKIKAKTLDLDFDKFDISDKAKRELKRVLELESRGPNKGSTQNMTSDNFRPSTGKQGRSRILEGEAAEHFLRGGHGAPGLPGLPPLDHGQSQFGGIGSLGKPGVGSSPVPSTRHQPNKGSTQQITPQRQMGQPFSFDGRIQTRQIQPFSFDGRISTQHRQPSFTFDGSIPTRRLNKGSTQSILNQANPQLNFGGSPNFGQHTPSGRSTTQQYIDEGVNRIGRLFGADIRPPAEPRRDITPFTFRGQIPVERRQIPNKGSTQQILPSPRRQQSTLNQNNPQLNFGGTPNLGQGRISQPGRSTTQRYIDEGVNRVGKLFGADIQPPDPNKGSTQQLTPPKQTWGQWFGSMFGGGSTSNPTIVGQDRNKAREQLQHQRAPYAPDSPARDAVPSFTKRGGGALLQKLGEQGRRAPSRTGEGLGSPYNTGSEGGGRDFGERVPQQGGSGAITGGNRQPSTEAGSPTNPANVIGEAASGHRNPGGQAVELALRQHGLHERRDRAAVMQYLRTGGAGMDPAQTSWCGAFVESTLRQSGHQGLGGRGNIATSWGSYGSPVRRGEDVQSGDVVVWHRGRTIGQTGGHVGLMTGQRRTGANGQMEFETISGNTSDRSLQSGDVVGRRWVPFNSNVWVRRPVVAEQFRQGAAGVSPTVNQAQASSPHYQEQQQRAQGGTHRIESGRPHADTWDRQGPPGGSPRPEITPQDSPTASPPAASQNSAPVSPQNQPTSPVGGAAGRYIGGQTIMNRFRQHADPSERPLLNRWLKDTPGDTSTAVHESVHLLSKDKLGGYLLPSGQHTPRIDADPEFGTSRYLPTPKSVLGNYPKIESMTDTYITGGRGVSPASSSRDFGYWLDEQNAYTHENFLHRETGGKSQVNFTGQMMFNAGTADYIGSLNPQQRQRLTSEHGESIRKIWGHAEEGMAYGANRFGSEQSEFFQGRLRDPRNQRAMEEVLGRPMRIPDKFSNASSGLGSDITGTGGSRRVHQHNHSHDSHGHSHGQESPQVTRSMGGRVAQVQGQTQGRGQEARQQQMGAAWGSRLMTDLQRDFNLQRHQAAGIVGNFHTETGGFRHAQEIRPVGGGRGGLGIAQWTGPRRRQFESWAQERNLQTNSYEAQYGFLKHELTNTPEKRVIGRLRGAQDANQASSIFMNTFERPGVPHAGRRAEAANRYARGGGEQVASQQQRPQQQQQPPTDDKPPGQPRRQRTRAPEQHMQVADAQPRRASSGRRRSRPTTRSDSGTPKPERTTMQNVAPRPRRQRDGGNTQRVAPVGAGAADRGQGAPGDGGGGGGMGDIAGALGGLFGGGRGGSGGSGDGQRASMNCPVHSPEEELSPIMSGWGQHSNRGRAF